MAQSIEYLLDRGLVNHTDTVKKGLEIAELCGPVESDVEMPIYLSANEIEALVLHIVHKRLAFPTKVEAEALPHVDRALKRIAHQLKANPIYDELMAVLHPEPESTDEQ